MADEREPGPAYTDNDLMVGEIAASFSSRFDSFRCSVCGNGDFQILANDSGEFLSQFNVYRQRYVQRTSGADVVGFACNNCGHIYHFSLDILRRKLREE